MRYIFQHLTGLLLLFVVLAPLGSTALAYTSPGASTGYVNDFAVMLNSEEKSTLEATLKNFHDQNGVEVAVVTIPTLAGDAIENYANTLFREWGIGKKDKNNGILFLISKEDRQVRIEVGYGYEGVLTDARSSEIVRNTIVPYFKQGEYGLGILNGTREILKVLTTPASQLDAPRLAHGFSWSGIFALVQNNLLFVLFFGYSIIVWLASILGRSKEWWLGGVAGGLIGLFIYAFIGLVFSGLITTGVLILLGLIFDYTVSKGYQNSVSNGSHPPWWTGGTWGGGGGFSGGGGFGGFGGGSSGGGGASGRW